VSPAVSQYIQDCLYVQQTAPIAKALRFPQLGHSVTGMAASEVDGILGTGIYVFDYLVDRNGFGQGCQMVCFHTKNANLGTFLRPRV
jgi:hypothetical protein